MGQCQEHIWDEHEFVSKLCRGGYMYRNVTYVFKDEKDIQTFKAAIEAYLKLGPLKIG